MALLLREGVAGISVKKVAAEASVNHGLVHYHFGSKEGLLVAAYDHYRHAQRARLAQAELRDRDRLRAVLLEEVRTSSGMMVEFAAFSMHMPRLRQAIEHGLTELVEGIRHRLELPSRHDGDLLLATFFGVAVHSRLRPSFDVDHAVAAFLDAYLGPA